MELESDLLHLVLHIDLLVRQVYLPYQFTLVKDTSDLLGNLLSESEQSTTDLVSLVTLVVVLKQFLMLILEEQFYSVSVVKH